MSLVMKKQRYIRLGGDIIDLSKGLIMGVFNVTPDSFYSESRVSAKDVFLEKVSCMCDDGMDILDIGGFSSRPGAKLPDMEEEWKRLHPILKAIKSNYPDLPLSVDTFRSEIARRVVGEFGVCLINDISGGAMDPLMPETIADLDVSVVLMHMKGNPATMQKQPTYNDVTMEIIHYFSEQIDIFRQKGVKDIVIDPGFGFGKTLEHNFEILKKLEMFSIFNLPLLIGISRKSMIQKVLNTGPDEAMNGTTALHSIARFKGADIFRVHDVKEISECLNLINKLIGY